MLSYNPTGQKWQAGPITWSFATSNLRSDSGSLFSDPISSPDQQAVVKNAIQRWSSVSGLVFTQVADSNTVDIRIGFGRLNTSTTGILGLTTPKGSGPFFSPDVIVRVEDPAETPLVGSGSALTYQDTSSQLYQTVLHELGHSLGLDHSLDPSSIMAPTVGTANRDLDATDIAGIDAIYNAELTPATLGRPVFRFFDAHDGGHFFTTSSAERDQLLSTRKDLNFEGVGYNAVNPAGNDPKAAPVYRFFDTHDGGHFFTTSQSERDQVLNTRPDLKFEGTGFSEHTTQQSGDSAVYRFFETTSGGHFFTDNEAEKNAVVATRRDMRLEGIAFYAPT